DTYLLPYWEGDTVYNETVMFMNEDKVPLLYRPTEIISVRSSDLKTEFVAGVDYELRDGKLCRLAGSAMPLMPEEVYYPAEPTQICHCGIDGHPYLLWGDDKLLWTHQVHVTYRHADKWDALIPQKSDKLEAFRKKAASGERVTVLFYGDSITTGACSSKHLRLEPYCDTWTRLVIYALRKHFKNDRIYAANPSIGGKNAQWGLEEVDERAIGIDPDLMILAFGMNNRTTEPEVFGEITKNIVDRFRAECPGVPVALLSTMLPHFRAVKYYGLQEKQEPVLAALAKQYPDVDLIPMTSMYRRALKTKRDYDMNANNINHPNDFAVRLYAQTILSVLIG
ncbi:MAG: SGNH/GDSL hydrolase family protein, partial [Clostridia bacterium]|nr:SGNH/GDSL hydrolase family protein [Clostridia bacterium]